MKTITTILIILLLFILAGIIAPRFFASHSYSRWDSARPKMASVESAIHVYKLNTGKLPAKLEDLVTCPAGFEGVWKGPYLKPSQLFDLWDRSFIYNITSDGYELISYGNDGKLGGEGYSTDIYND